MTGPIFSCTLVGCIFAMSLMAQSAKAADGRIVFSGAIVEPTCGFASERAVAIAAEISDGTVRVACAGSGGVTTAAPQAYAEQVMLLSAAAPDHLLAYFASYANSSGSTGGVAAKVVTRSYE